MADFRTLPVSKLSLADVWFTLYFRISAVVSHKKRNIYRHVTAVSGTSMNPDLHSCWVRSPVSAECDQTLHRSLP